MMSGGLSRTSGFHTDLKALLHSVLMDAFRPYDWRRYIGSPNSLLTKRTSPAAPRLTADAVPTTDHAHGLVFFSAILAGKIRRVL